MIAYELLPLPTDCVTISAASLAAMFLIVMTIHNLANNLIPPLKLKAYVILSLIYTPLADNAQPLLPSFAREIETESAKALPSTSALPVRVKHCSHCYSFLAVNPQLKPQFGHDS
jgi:hypothetical protein